MDQTSNTETTYKGLETRLNSALQGANNIRTYTGQLLAERDIQEIKELVQQDNLNASELRTLVYLLAATEIKLVNFNERDRWIAGKFLTWIRDFITLQETNIKQLDVFNEKFDVLDYQEIVKKREMGEDTTNMITPTTKHTYDTIYCLLDEDIKYLVDIYLFITRSTLSLEGAAFDSLGKNRQEVVYTPQQPGINQEQGKKKFWGS